MILISPHKRECNVGKVSRFLKMQIILIVQFSSIREKVLARVTTLANLRRIASYLVLHIFSMFHKGLWVKTVVLNGFVGQYLT